MLITGRCHCGNIAFTLTWDPDPARIPARACGCVPVVTSRIDERLFAVVSVNAFENVDASILQRTLASFDGESDAVRLARRTRHWIADVAFDTGAA